jgi:hypothetical protein
MAAPYRPRDKSDRIDCESFQCTHERIGMWEKELGEDKTRDDAVEKEIIPFYGRSDGAGHDGAPELGAVFAFRKRDASSVDHGWLRPPPVQAKLQRCIGNFRSQLEWLAVAEHRSGPGPWSRAADGITSARGVLERCADATSLQVWRRRNP